MVSGCGDDDTGTVSPTPGAAAEAVEGPVVVEWYPTPKHQHRPQYFMPPPAPAQSRQPQVTSQPIQQRFAWGYMQPVPQAWVLPAPPVAGYGTATGVPVQGAWYAPVPAWNRNAQPAQSSLQPAQQQYYPLAPQQAYAQRPWGAADKVENSNRAGQSMNTWQTTNELPAWGAPLPGGYPVQNPGLYSTYQGTVETGRYW